jgi:hypothetical protein
VLARNDALLGIGSSAPIPSAPVADAVGPTVPPSVYEPVRELRTPVVTVAVVTGPTMAGKSSFANLIGAVLGRGRRGVIAGPRATDRTLKAAGHLWSSAFKELLPSNDASLFLVDTVGSPYGELPTSQTFAAIMAGLPPTVLTQPNIDWATVTTDATYKPKACWIVVRLLDLISVPSIASSTPSPTLSANSSPDIDATPPLASSMGLSAYFWRYFARSDSTAQAPTTTTTSTSSVQTTSLVKVTEVEAVGRLYKHILDSSGILPLVILTHADYFYHASPELAALGYCESAVDAAISGLCDSGVGTSSIMRIGKECVFPSSDGKCETFTCSHWYDDRLGDYKEVPELLSAIGRQAYH